MTADSTPSGDAITAIAELKQQVQTFCEKRDWDQFHSAKDLAIGVITEAAELVAHFRFRSEAESDALFDDPGTRAAISAELADVAIFLLRFAQRYGIDLTRAVLDKLDDNARRYPVETARGNNEKAGH